MIETIEFNGTRYPAFQSEGNAAQFAIPFAKHVCKGQGFDVGCGRPEWAFPGAIIVDPAIDARWDADTLPSFPRKPDYIFSSHCLEHVEHWVATMDYWYERLKLDGTLFLYLPDFSQEYWRPWNNTKHRHVLTPEIIRAYMIRRGYRNVFVSGIDLNNSFMAMGEK